MEYLIVNFLVTFHRSLTVGIFALRGLGKIITLYGLDLFLHGLLALMVFGIELLVFLLEKLLDNRVFHTHIVGYPVNEY